MEEGTHDCTMTEVGDNDLAEQDYSQISSTENLDTDQTSPSEQDHHPTTDCQEDPKLEVNQAEQEAIDLRIQQLLSRRLLLQKIQQCLKTEEISNDKTLEETHIKDDGEQSELNAIQNELEELENNRKVFKLQGETDHKNLPVYKHSPRGGVYMLPPLLPEQSQEVTATDDGEENTVVSVENLGKTEQVTRCPSCGTVIVTKTHDKIGGTAWILCFLCFLLGCVAGCCLIPFFVKRFRNVHHTCPRCNEQIHIYHPI